MYPDGDKNLNYETISGIYFFTTPYDPFSNWSPHQIAIWGKVFPTLEHAYHYKKFEKDNPKIAEQVMSASSPWAAKKISRKYESKRYGDWDKIKIEVMKELATAKFLQHDDAQELLLKTRGKIIYENSPWDSYWGLGADGKGMNMLGKILMEVRTQLQAGGASAQL